MGFVPVRQLVLVDLLSMVLGVRPGERAVVAVDTAAASGTARLCAELSAVADRVAGRELLTVSSPEAEPRRTESLVRRFRSGSPLEARPGAGAQPEPRQPARDAVLLVAGAFLLRPALAAQWDASVYVETQTSARPAEQLYREQAPEQQATWVLDDRRREAPTLTDGACAHQE